MTHIHSRDWQIVHFSLSDPSCPTGVQSGLSCLATTAEVPYFDAAAACADIGFVLWTPEKKPSYPIIADLVDDEPMWVQTGDSKANTTRPPTQGNKAVSQCLLTPGTN